MPSFRVTGVRTIVIPVSNIEVSSVFYKQVLGLEEEYATGEMIGLRIGPGGVGMLLHPIQTPEPVENGLVIELAVDNVDAAVTAVAASTGRVVQQPIDRDWGVREAVITDPDGYRIWLVQPKG